MKSITPPIAIASHKKRTVQSTMLHVTAALLPGTVLYSIIIDDQIFANLLIAFSLSTACEAICLALRKRPALNSILDGSTILATWLLVLCVPQTLPTWQLCIGVVVLVVLGKQIFGGLGQNPFNPAMVAYAVLLISFPVTMTSWGSHQSSNATVVTNNAENLYEVERWDALSGATTLDRVRQLKRSQNGTADVENYQLKHMIQEQFFNSPWSWIALTWLAGGIYLLIVKIISWHIPLSVLATVSLLYASSSFLNIPTLLSPVAALLSGGILLGAFFIATDPVSAATSRMGQVIFGIGIGIFAFIIREFSVYPEGFAFAVLLMNMCVPLIDHISLSKHKAHDSSDVS